MTYKFLLEPIQIKIEKSTLELFFELTKDVKISEEQTFVAYNEKLKWLLGEYQIHLRDCNRSLD